MVTPVQGLGHTLQMQIVEATPERVVMTMPVTAQHLQPWGYLHGGASVALAETAATAGAFLNCPAGMVAFGQEINANHIRSVREGMLTATAIPLHIGRTSQVWEIDIRNEQQKRVCVSRCTLAVIASDAARATKWNGTEQGDDPSTGLAIPVVSSCTTLAVMSAVPTKQAGLASGTLGMARNIGTAFGVAVLSQVYLFHTNTTLPPSLAPSWAAADQFVVSGTDANRLLIEVVILQGFKLTALTCLVLYSCAAVLAFFLLRQERKRSMTKPVQQEEQHLAVPPDG